MSAPESHDAEDIVQDVFLSLLRGQPDLASLGSGPAAPRMVSFTLAAPWSWTHTLPDARIVVGARNG
jgi:hypothetical protein